MSDNDFNPSSMSMRSTDIISTNISAGSIVATNLKQTPDCSVKRINNLCLAGFFFMVGYGFSLVWFEIAKAEWVEWCAGFVALYCAVRFARVMYAMYLINRHLIRNIKK